MAKNYSENTSNKILTHEMVAKEAAAMLVEESQFIKAINRNRDVSLCFVGGAIMDGAS